MKSIEPFVEHSIVPSRNASEIVSRDVRPYLQGLELSTDDDYFSGLVKIHVGNESGEKYSHHQNVFGQSDSDISSNSAYTDNDRFDSTVHIQRTTTVGYDGTNQVKRLDVEVPFLDYENASRIANFNAMSLDGVITIVKFENVVAANQKIRKLQSTMQGALQSGNETEQYHESDSVSCIIENSLIYTSKYYDCENLSVNQSLMNPYFESIDGVNGKSQVNYDQQMMNVALCIANITELANTKKKITSCEITDSRYGIDSIAFGGMLYISSSASRPFVI